MCFKLRFTLEGKNFMACMIKMDVIAKGCAKNIFNILEWLMFHVIALCVVYCKASATTVSIYLINPGFPEGCNNLPIWNHTGLTHTIHIISPDANFCCCFYQKWNQMKLLVFCTWQKLIVWRGEWAFCFCFRLDFYCCYILTGKNSFKKGILKVD